MLSPPSSKNPSSMPTGATPSTSANSPHNNSSRASRGPRNTSPPRSHSGTGNARRSTFPFTVNGSASSTTTAAGTMYSGNHSRVCARISRSVQSPSLTT